MARRGRGHDEVRPSPPNAPVEANASLMRFGRDTPLLEAPALIALAVVLAIFIAWLVLTTREPNWLDVLRWIAAGVIGVVGIAYAGSWNDVVVDAGAKQVEERYGFLRYHVKGMSKQLSFADITAVVVERRVSKETKAAGTSMSRNTRTVYEASYVLNLQRRDIVLVLPDRKIVAPNYPVALPMEERQNPLLLEATARQLARLGGWPARRRHYAIEVAGAPDSPDRSHVVKPAPHGTETPIED